VVIHSLLLLYTLCFLRILATASQSSVTLSIEVQKKSSMFGMAHISFKWPLFSLQQFLDVYSGSWKVCIHEDS